MAQLMVPLMVISAGTAIAGGLSKRAAANKEAQALEGQANLAQQEAESDARIHATQVRKFAANQKSAYLKNGVTLDGSPLLVLEDTRQVGQEEVNSMMRSGAAKAQLLRDRAQIQRNEGRASLIGGFGDAASTIFTYGAARKTAGLTKGII